MEFERLRGADFWTTCLSHLRDEVVGCLAVVCEHRLSLFRQITTIPAILGVFVYFLNHNWSFHVHLRLYQ